MNTSKPIIVLLFLSLLMFLGVAGCELDLDDKVKLQPNITGYETIWSKKTTYTAVDWFNTFSFVTQDLDVFIVRMQYHQASHRERRAEPWLLVFFGRDVDPHQFIINNRLVGTHYPLSSWHNTYRFVGHDARLMTLFYNSYNVGNQSIDYGLYFGNWTSEFTERNSYLLERHTMVIQTYPHGNNLIQLRIGNFRYIDDSFTFSRLPSDDPTASAISVPKYEFQGNGTYVWTDSETFRVRVKVFLRDQMMPVETWSPSHSDNFESNTPPNGAMSVSTSELFMTFGNAPYKLQFSIMISFTDLKSHSTPRHIDLQEPIWLLPNPYKLREISLVRPNT